MDGPKMEKKQAMLDIIILITTEVGRNANSLAISIEIKADTLGTKGSLDKTAPHLQMKTNLR